MAARQARVPGAPPSAHGGCNRGRTLLLRPWPMSHWLRQAVLPRPQPWSWCLPHRRTGSAAGPGLTGMPSLKVAESALQATKPVAAKEGPSVCGRGFDIAAPAAVTPARDACRSVGAGSATPNPQPMLFAAGVHCRGRPCWEAAPAAGGATVGGVPVEKSMVERSRGGSRQQRLCVCVVRGALRWIASTRSLAGRFVTGLRPTRCCSAAFE